MTFYKELGDSIDLTVLSSLKNISELSAVLFVYGCFFSFKRRISPKVAIAQKQIF